MPILIGKKPFHEYFGKQRTDFAIENLVVFASNNGNVIGFEQDSGDQTFLSSDLSRAFGASFDAFNGVIGTAGSGGIYLIEAGGNIESTQVTSASHFSIMVDTFTNDIYVGVSWWGNYDGISRYDASGNLIKSGIGNISTGGAVYSLDVTDTHIYAGTRADNVHKIDKNTGDVVWTFTGHSYWVRQVRVDENDFVYSVALDNTVRKIDPDGDQVWSHSLGGGRGDAMDIDNQGFVYAGSTSGFLQKLDPDGNQVDIVDLENDLYSIKVNVDGDIYVGLVGEVKKVNPNFTVEWTVSQGFSGETWDAAISNPAVFNGIFNS